jgi:alanine dehydrogenase
LTNATLSYGLEIADRGLARAIAENPSLGRGLNTSKGKVNHEGVAQAFGLELAAVEEMIEG